MEFTAAEIAQLINGEIEGDETVKVKTLSKIDEGQPNSVSFLYNEAYKEFLYTTQASVVIVNDSMELTQPVTHTSLIRVPDARMAFNALLLAYKKLRMGDKQGIHPTAHVEAGAKIGENVYIGPFTFVSKSARIGDNTLVHAHCVISENVVIGTDCTVYNNVSIHEDCQIGDHCVIQSGAVIGGDGFGFQPNAQNDYTKIAHIGNVILEDHVEVGANTTIDRATLGSTLIRKGVKLDNLVQVGHNVEVGENTVIASQTGLAGSVQVGKNCMIAGQVGIAGHLKVADGVKIAAKTGVAGHLPQENGVYHGNPAMPNLDFKRSYVLFRKLPDMRDSLETLKKEWEAWKQKSDAH